MSGAEFAQGGSLSFALVGTRSLDAALGFYRDVIGLAVAAQGEASLQVAADDATPRPARLALLHEPGTPVGRVLLAEFATPGAFVRQPGDRTSRGFWNLNFYVDDIDASTAQLRARGFEFWSDPETYVVGTAAGVAREVVFETADSVAINLVEPRGDASTFTGRVRAEVARHGKTPRGFTPVATTAHCVRDVAAASAFYRDVLGMQVVLDETLGRPETNRFLARPADARTHTVFMAGAHFYGKIALNEPQNFFVPERVAAQHAPNAGYLAQGFVVDDLPAMQSRLGLLGVACELRPFPTLGGSFGAQCLQLRIPGSGAYALLVDQPSR